MRAVHGIAALVLSGGTGARDHIELHFRASLGPAMQATLAAVLPTMARTRANRQVGLLTRTVVNRRATADPAVQRPVPDTVLGTSNPAGSAARSSGSACFWVAASR